MVLQNKYKAKASRRYNLAKDGKGQDQAEGSTKPGFRQRHFNRFSSGRQDGQDQEASSGGDQDDEDDQQDQDDEEEEEDGGDVNFPSLTKAFQGMDRSEQQRDEDPRRPSRGKYSRRRLGESNAARMERLLAEEDPHLQDSDPEPEIDISSLVARVAALNPDAQTQAGIAAHKGERETASDVEKDIDHGLYWLHEREKQRQKLKGKGGWEENRPAGQRSDFNKELRDVDADGNQIDWEQMKREKEKAEALRALKARFQGRGLGERERRDARVKNAPSIKIGPRREIKKDQLADVGPPISGISGRHSVSSSGRFGFVSTSSSLSPSSTHAGPSTIDASLARQRKLAGVSNKDASSGSSRSSSFSTSFGRRVKPMAVKDFKADKKIHPATDHIDSFLASLKLSEEPGLRQGEDPNSGTSSGRTPQSSGSMRTHRFTQPSGNDGASNKGEIERLESFLDDMLS